MSKIGVFDSGFGGLTVLKEIVSLLPQYDYIYLGDNARAPYGSKSQDLIYEYTRQAVDYLFSHDCELIILACNTASSEALRKIQQEYLPTRHPDKRVLGVIIPVAEAIAKDESSKKVGVIATEGTVKSETYIKEIKKLNKNIEVFQNAAPLLVPLIESGEVSGADIDKYIGEYLGPLLEQNIDSLVLGCTHYAIIEEEIRKVLEGKINIYNQSLIVANRLADYLGRHPEITSKLSAGGKIWYYSTDSQGNFEKSATKIMGSKVVSSGVILDSKT